MLRSRLNQLNYKTKTIPRPLNGGLNNGFLFDSKDNEFSEVSNLQTRAFPAVRTRAPRTNVGAALTGPVRHLGKREGDYLTAVDNLDWKKYDGGVWTTITALTEPNKASSVDFYGWTYLVNGEDRKRYDGSTVEDVTDMPSAIDLIEVYSSRLYGASTENDSLYFSAIATGDDWTTANDAGEIQVTTNDGQNCTGLVSYNNHIIYFKKNSVHELYGTKPDNFILQPLSNQIGCVNPRSIVEVEGVLYFVGTDGVYSYGGGVAPKKISWPYIQKYFDEIDDTRFDECVAGTDGDVLYLVIPYGASDRILVTFNTDSGIWAAEDEISIEEFRYFNNLLYGLGTDGQLRDMVDEDGDWSGISGFFITKAYDKNSISSKKTLHQVHVAAEIAPDASIQVSVSAEAKDGSFTQIGEITDTALSVRQFIVPITFNGIADWNRIKVSYTGEVTIHNIEVQMRLRPNNF